jgi:DNA replication and checkpoint protein
MINLNKEKDPRTILKSFKRELKAWEHQFQDENNRKPNKKDIANETDIGTKFYLPSS